MEKTSNAFKIYQKIKLFNPMENLKKWISTSWTGAKYIAMTICTAIILFNACLGVVWLMSDTEPEYTYKVYRYRTELYYHGLKDQLVTATDNYIQKVGPGSCLNGLTLVEACDKYNIDLKFVLAQGHIESHFGTKGIAARTNSVFNVGAFDGQSSNQIIKNGYGYRHPDFSVEPYLIKLKDTYLVGKTELDMFIKFENVRGERYASNKNYEKQLYSIYEKIDSISNITEIYKEYKKYKTLLQLQ